MFVGVITSEDDAKTSLLLRSIYHAYVSIGKPETLLFPEVEVAAPIRQQRIDGD